MFQQDIMLSSTQDNAHMIIVVLPTLALLSMLIWFKFRCDTSSMLIMILPIAMDEK